MTLGPLTQLNYQPKLLILYGAICGLGGLAIAASTSPSNFWMFWAFYCLSWSLNTGFAYLVTTHHTWLWFPQNPGLASGICMGGYGIGALFFTEIMTPIINPNNDSFINPCFAGANYGCYPQSVNENFQKTLYILIATFFGIVMIGILTIWQGPLPQRPTTMLDVRDTEESAQINSSIKKPLELNELPDVEKPDKLTS